MIIYIGMIFWILFVSGVCRKKRVQNKITGEKEYRATFLCAMLSMGIIVFFIGLRSAGADTHAYIKMFNDLPVGIENIKNVIRSDVGEKGFEIFGIFIKTFISQDYHVYLFIIAAISGFCIASVLRRYSAYFTTSMILFMLAGTFTWMINGIRQFLVASIAFFFSRFDFEKKTNSIYPFNTIIIDYSYICNYTFTSIFYCKRRGVE